MRVKVLTLILVLSILAAIRARIEERNRGLGSSANSVVLADEEPTSAWNPLSRLDIGAGY